MKLELRENRHGGSHTSPNGVSEFVPYFLYFLTDFDEGRCHGNLEVISFSITSSVKIVSVEAVLCVRTQINFFHVYLVGVKCRIGRGSALL